MIQPEVAEENIMDPEDCSHPELIEEIERGDELGAIDLLLYCPYCETGGETTVEFDSVR